jgi:HD domain
MLAPLGALAALHHERLDGSGYHRQMHAERLPAAARILAAADVYQTGSDEERRKDGYQYLIVASGHHTSPSGLSPIEHRHMIDHGAWAQAAPLPTRYLPLNTGKRLYSP